MERQQSEEKQRKAERKARKKEERRAEKKIKSRSKGKTKRARITSMSGGLKPLAPLGGSKFNDDDEDNDMSPKKKVSGKIFTWTYTRY